MSVESNQAARFDVQHRDCFDSLAAMRDAGGVRLIVTSPPYPDARSAGAYGGAEFDTTVEGYGRLGEAIFEALMPGGVCALNIDGPVRVWRPELGESERSLIAFEVAIDWAKRIGFRYVERCTYRRDGFVGDVGPRWCNDAELCHVFARPGAPVIFDRWAHTVKSSAPNRRSGGGAPRSLAGPQPTGRYEQGNRRALRTTVDVGNTPNSIDPSHGAPFSSLLADAYVLCYSQPGDIVGDPFVGSGTVAFSCHRHGRRFIGGDLGHRERDGRRWADIVNDGLRQTTLFDP